MGRRVIRPRDPGPPTPEQVGVKTHCSMAAAPLPDGVTWTQDEESVEVVVTVSESVVRADLHVKTTADSLSVHVKDGTTARPVLIGSLRHDVERESCCWALESRRKGGKVLTIQLEKKSEGSWDALLRASAEGSILEELGRDQVIVDAGASTSESVACGRCGALVKRSRWEAHTTMWCEALSSEEGAEGASGSAGGALAELQLDEDVESRDGNAKSPAAHLYWAREPTNPAGSVPPRKLGNSDEGCKGELV
jgi:hypothetical protein